MRPFTFLTLFLASTVIAAPAATTKVSSSAVSKASAAVPKGTGNLSSSAIKGTGVSAKSTAKATASAKMTTSAKPSAAKAGEKRLVWVKRASSATSKAATSKATSGAAKATGNVPSSTLKGTGASAKSTAKPSASAAKAPAAGASSKATAVSAKSTSKATAPGAGAKTTAKPSSSKPAAAAAASAPVMAISQPRKLSPATPPTASDITNSMTNWATSVNTVNDWLNDPNNQTKLVTAVAYAKDEPVQLATMMKVTGLSATGQNSAKILMGNFPSIVSNLQNVQTGAMNTQDATAAVNFNRCCTVLPAIGALWTSAATATKAPAMPPPNLEDQCAKMSCASGASANTTAFNSSGTELTTRDSKIGFKSVRLF